MRFCFCYCLKEELKDDMDLAGGSVTYLAKAFDQHSIETREIFSKFLQLLQSSPKYDAEHIERLCRDYVTSEKNLDSQKDKTLYCMETLFQHIPSKKKKKKDSMSGRRKLEEYILQEKPVLPQLVRNSTKSNDEIKGTSTEENQSRNIFTEVVIEDDKDQRKNTRVKETDLSSGKTQREKEQERLIKRHDSDSMKGYETTSTKREYEAHNIKQNIKSKSEVSKNKHEKYVDPTKNIKSYESEFSPIYKENNQKQTQLSNYKHEVSKLKEQLDLEKKENKELSIKIKQLESDVEILNSTMSGITENCKKDLKEIKKEKEKIERDMQKIQAENIELAEKLQKSKNDVDIWYKKTQNEKSIIEQIKEEKALIEKGLMNDLKQLQATKQESEEKLTSLEKDHRELKQFYEIAKEELDKFKAIKTIKIQLYHNSNVPLISKVENELKSLLKKEIESSSTKLEFIVCEAINDIDPSEPLLIVCVCASRLGTDAANAVQSLRLTSNMALLVFHHKDGHALPNQASEHVLTGNEYKRLGGIFDFGFLSGKGIYPCEMNDQNFKNIVHFIHREK